MTEEQLIKWFIDLYNSCYPFIHNDFPESIFMIYDKRFIRKIKLCQISNIEFKIPDVNICQGQFLFELDCKNKIFYYDYDKIYSFLQLNHIGHKKSINDFIHDRLMDLNISTTKYSTTKYWPDYDVNPYVFDLNDFRKN